jgi:hypothetical protein
VIKAGSRQISGVNGAMRHQIPEYSMHKLSLALATVLALTGVANAATLSEKNMPLDVATRLAQSGSRSLRHRQVQRLGGCG